MTPIHTHFQSKGLQCAGTLYLPPTSHEPRCPPVIVMAHGFACVRALTLPDYARRFVEAGYAVYLFDYRNFGDSEGLPRHWVDPARHLQDWGAAVRHVKTLPEVDARRIVLWGTSLSGGHVICTAARGDADIAAVIAQHPHVDGLAALASVRLSVLARAMVAGMRDVAGRLVGRPHYIPVIARAGELAALSSDEAARGLQRLMAVNDVAWENKVLARVVFKIGGYSPLRQASRVRVPALVIAGTRDGITPWKSAREAARRMPHAEFRRFDCDHFDPYLGEYFEANVRAHVDFLHRHVPVQPRLRRAALHACKPAPTHP